MLGFVRWLDFSALLLLGLTPLFAVLALLWNSIVFLPIVAVSVGIIGLISVWGVGRFAPHVVNEHS